MKKIFKTWSASVFFILMVAILALTASAEAGGQMSSAQKINVNTAYTDNISTKSDVDFFKFTLDSPGCVSFTLKRENQYDKQEYWSIALLDSNSNVLISNSFLGDKEKSTTYNLGLAKGTYYVRIRGGAWSSERSTSGVYTKSN